MAWSEAHREAPKTIGIPPIGIKPSQTRIRRYQKSKIKTLLAGPILDALHEGTHQSGPTSFRLSGQSAQIQSMQCPTPRLRTEFIAHREHRTAEIITFQLHLHCIIIEIRCKNKRNIFIRIMKGIRP